ncbi:MAG: dTDP-4-dehydrorhamnose reductase [Ignavibacteriales bacterium]
MKILITGAKGMLGYALQKVLAEGHQIICSDIDDFDITDVHSTLRWITNVQPQVVIHSAGYTNVDGCENNIELAYRVNGLGARNVAAVCSELDAAMIYISSDYVFDGRKSEPYREYDQVNPLSIYGKSKLLGETLVKEMLNRHYIIRTSWLFGPNGKNFVTSMLQLSREMKNIKVVNDQVGSPTYTFDLAQAVKILLTGPYYGTYHITNSDYCSWYDFAQEIFRLAGINNQVFPTTTEQLNRPAPRPAYSVLDNYLWKNEGFQILRSYKEALREYMESL